ncbi:MAG TPA: TonB-dependent receptor [Steroidobacteraceae bacterium]|nr:TonB-dependent receptor [Steroidobacteraceae bacterium]
MSKPSRRLRQRTPHIVKPLFYLTSAILAGAAPARAQQAPAPNAGDVLEEVIVTSQKRAENLQSVPISILAYDTKKLDELQVASFDDYAKYLPSLSVQSYGPGQAQLYVRGVTNGGDGLLVGSQPLVGVYVDEMPVTTIANNLDVHIYDIARIEALSGPQGTLFGASSMTGTLRIITNQPNPSKTEGGYDITLNTFTKGDPGAKVESYVNAPINDHAAIRLVGWAEHDGGYINNVASPPGLVFPTSGLPRENSRVVEKNYNWVDTVGGRGALRIELSDQWSLTPMLMTQRQTANGQFAYTPFAVAAPAGSGVATIGGSGDLNISHYYPERYDDNWWLATLTVQGKIGNIDAMYAGGYIKRTTLSYSDYSDYSFFYDSAYGGYFQDNAGNLINPSQQLYSRSDLTKQSHEFRITSPTDWRLRFVAGAFLQRQVAYPRDEYRIANLQDADHAVGTGLPGSLDGLPGVIYVNSQIRTDRDSALFTDISFDLTKKLTLTGGIRAFHYDNTVYGFFGYGTSGWSASGEQQCLTPIETNNPVRPCINIDYRASKSSETHRVNLTYKFDDDRMIYSTWSTGFRPGGVNRVATRPPYESDYLTNFELGWKTTWLEHRLRFNGALFYEKWKDAQYAIAGQNGITEIVNAGSSAIKGIETEVQWRAAPGLTISGSATYLDAKLTSNACNQISDQPDCGSPDNILAPDGSRLPVSSKLKANLIGRYEWTAGNFDAHVQGAVVYQSDVVPTLTQADLPIVGMQPGFTSVDVTSGVSRDKWSVTFFIDNLFDERGEAIRYTTCTPQVCNLVNVIPIKPRQVGITFAQKF